jgi:hypothetical protein
VKPKGPASALRAVAVHVVTEGFDLGPAAPAVRAELAAKAPDSAVHLGLIWKRLTREARAAIETAWRLEMQGASLRVARRRRSQDTLPSALGAKSQ